MSWPWSTMVFLVSLGSSAGSRRDTAASSRVARIALPSEVVLAGRRRPTLVKGRR